jgi:hypothetical protein
MKRGVVCTGLAALGAALLAASGAEARGGHFASFGPGGLTPRVRVDVRQTVVVRQVVQPAFGGVVAAAGIRRAPVAAPALYVIEPAPRSASRGRSLRRGAPHPEVLNGTGGIEPAIRPIRIPRG